MKIGQYSLLVFGILSCTSLSSVRPTGAVSYCDNHSNSCSSCIQQPGCKWCSKKKPGQTIEQNCFAIADNFDFCEENSIENPETEDIDYVSNNDFTPLTKGDTAEKKKIVQLKPQEIRLKLRKGVPRIVTLKYRQLKNYPLDLYYLMDLSKSMNSSKTTVGELGTRLAIKMRSLTEDFRIGFGSFVDKVMAPFVNIHEAALINPCIDANEDCDSPFAFKNNLRLTTNDAMFKQEVHRAKISGNLDTPEGGLDALMQSMVCEKEIGWRDGVRKIIVLSTDAPFHFAGDGKLAGVVEPNDEKCHMNAKGFYDKYDLFDYPSIGQIERIAITKGINIIFAVLGYADLYQALADRIRDAEYARLDSKSDNIINIIEQVYKTITNKVEITQKSEKNGSPVSIRYFSTCQGKERSETRSCLEVTENTTLTFDIELTLKDCPKKEKETTVVVGTLQDLLTIHIDYECECGCEKETHPGYQEDSESCSRSGTKQCSVCLCQDGYYGKKCQCDRNSITDELTNDKNDENKCRSKDKKNEGAVCSGRGICQCEVCNCHEGYSGAFCQCRTSRCQQKLNSEKCFDHGTCNCNDCICDPDWQGEFCQCPVDRFCKAEGEHALCSGNGKCNCGRCECNVTFTGKYCEECQECGMGKCKIFQKPVGCHLKIFEGEDCIDPAPAHAHHIVEYASLDAVKRKDKGTRDCFLRHDSTGCVSKFTYIYNKDTSDYTINVQRAVECPEPANLVAIGFGVITGVVAIGILTLVIWKVVTSYQDRREYENFKKQANDADWQEGNTNRMYKKPVSEVQNPAYKGSVK